MKKHDLSVLCIFVASFISLAFMEHNDEVINMMQREKVTTISIDNLQQPLQKIDADTQISLAEIEIADKSLEAFKHQLGLSESSNNYKAENRFGYIGKYQFGRSALSDVNLSNMSRYEFKRRPEIQEKALNALLSMNKYRLRNYMHFIGVTINDVKITESGMLAAAHLVGAKSVKKYLRSSGTKNRADANNVTVEMYMFKFSSFDMSSIKSKRKVHVVNN